MEEVSLLVIRTFNGDIEIPFKDLEMLDEFTVRYKDREELINGLYAMLDMPVERKYVDDVYVHYEYMRNDNLRQKNVYVKYSEHNFDKKTLSSFLKDFLKKNHDMILYCGVRKIRSRAMRAFVYEQTPIPDYEIDYAVDKYFEGAPYGVFRKNYFFLRDNGIKVNINMVKRADKRTVDRNLSKFHSEDDYVQSLLKLARDSDDYDKIYDELARIDLEDLKTTLINSHFGLLDGVNNDRGYQLEDLYDLEVCTGRSIDDLCKIVSNVRPREVRR